MGQRWTRKNTLPVEVDCLPEKRAQLQGNAPAAQTRRQGELLKVVQAVVIPRDRYAQFEPLN
jgi:hypothetical protein